MKKEKIDFIEHARQIVWENFTELGVVFDTELDKIEFHELFNKAQKTIPYFWIHVNDIFEKISELSKRLGSEMVDMPGLASLFDMIKGKFFLKTSHDIIMIKKPGLEIGVFTTKCDDDINLYECLIRAPQEEYTGKDLPIFEARETGGVCGIFCIKFVEEFSMEQKRLLKNAHEVGLRSAQEFESMPSKHKDNTGQNIDYSKLN